MPETKKLKVIHVVTMLELGGAQQNTLFTASNLDKNLFDVTLVCGRGGILDESALKASVKIIFAGNLVRPVRPAKDFLAFWELFRIFKREKPDLIHTHSSKAGILARLAALPARVPFIAHTFHGFGFNSRQPWPVRYFYKVVEKICGSFSDALIFVSEANLREAREIGIGAETGYHLIRSGIRLEDYPAKGADPSIKRRESGIPEAGPLVISVGNLKPQKNPLDFIRVARLVSDECPDAFFLFTGDGELRPAVEGLLKELKLETRCFFPGWRRDVAELLSIAKIFVLTSLWEGLPRSLVEALKCGLPGVCYETDGVADILKDGRNGFVIKQKDVRGMAEKIIALLKSEKLYADMAENAAQTDLSEFDIVSMVRAQEKLYLSLAGKQKTAKPHD